MVLGRASRSCRLCPVHQPLKYGFADYQCADCGGWFCRRHCTWDEDAYRCRRCRDRRREQARPESEAQR